MTVKVDGHFINKDFRDAGILKAVEAYQTWGLMERQSEFASLLNMLSHGTALSSKIVELPIERKAVSVFPIALDTTIGAVGTTVNLTIDNAYPKYLPGQILRLVDTAGAGSQTALIRIAVDGAVGGTNTVYANCQVVSNDAAGSTWHAASTQAQVLGVSTKYDSVAPEPVDVHPAMLRNVMQDFRESFAKGRREMSDTVLFDNSMGHLEKIAYKDFMEKFATTLFLSDNYLAPTDEDYGVMMGLNGFFKTSDPTAVYKGENLAVSSGMTFDYKDLLDYVARFKTGATTKALVGSAETISRFLNILRNVMSVQKSDFSFPDSPIIWNGLQAHMAFGDLLLIPDRTLSGKSIYINDSSHDFYTNDYAFIVDLDATKIANLNVEGSGPATITTKDVALSNNDTRTMKEIETIATLTMTDPSTGGVIAFE